MPRVPPIESSVRDAALPGVRVQGTPSPSDFGADVGGTLQRAGLAMFERELHAQDQAAVMDAENRAGAEYINILTRMKDMRGKDAAGAEDFARGEFENSYTNLRQGLTGRQQRMFDRVIQPKIHAIHSAAKEHFRVENDKLLEDTFQANMKQSVDFARANADFPMADGNLGTMQLEAEKDIQELKIRNRAERLGFDEATVQDQVRSMHSTTNRAVIEALLTKGQDLKAKAYYDRVLKQEQGGLTEEGQGKLQFTASDREAVERSLEVGSSHGEAHRQYLKILAEVGKGTAKDRRLALNQADVLEIDNPKVGALVRQKLEHAFAQEDHRKREEHEEQFSQAIASIDQMKGDHSITVEQMVPAPIWAEMSPAERATMTKYREGFLPQAAKRGTDLETWVKINAMKDEDLAKVPRSKMMEWVQALDNGDGDKLLTRWNGVINAAKPDGGKQKDIKYEEFLTNKQMVDNAMELTGYFDMTKSRAKWPVEHQQLENRVYKLVDQALAQIPKDAPRAQKEKAIQDIVNSQVKERVKVGGFNLPFFGQVGGTERAVGEFEDFPEGARVRVPLKDIPSGDQDLIKGLLRDGNKKLDNGKIERIYGLKQLQKAGKITRQALIDQTRAIIQE